MRKLVVSFVVVALLAFCLRPIPAEAAAKIKNGGTYTEKQLNNFNLSVGTITWNDSLLAGSLTVTPNKDYTKFTVTIREMWPDGLPAHPSKKMATRNAAKSAFIPIRAYAQEKGWWDCYWKITKSTDKKLVATAKVEYKAVKINEKSKELNIKQTTTLKNGKYTTTYTVNGKKYTAAKLKKLFK